MALPHITNSQAGRNKWDPVYKSMFEVYFTIPEALRKDFGRDEQIITEHIQSVTWGEIDKGPAAIEQKFMGTSRSYLAAKLDNTYLDINVKLSLNLREGTDAYIYKLFKAWNKLCYDVQTGATTLKKDYCADWMKVSIANRANDVFREIVFKDIIMTGGIKGWDAADYSDGAAIVDLEITFRCDWWTDISA